MNSAERLVAVEKSRLKLARSSTEVIEDLSEQKVTKSTQPKFVKILYHKSHYAVISKDAEVFVLSDPFPGAKINPMFTQLNIPRKMPLIDIALTSRSFLVVFSEGSSLCIEKMATRMAELEYEKNKELQQSDYLESPDRKSPLKLKPTASSNSQSHKKYFTFEPTNLLPQVSKESDRSKNTPARLSKLQKVKSRVYESLEKDAPSTEERLLRNIGLRQVVAQKVKAELNMMSLMQQKKREDIHLKADQLISVHKFELPEEERKQVHKQPPVLLSDYDYKSTSQMSVLAYSQGDQSRSIWMKIVADGKQEELFNNTLKYLLEKPIEKSIPKLPRESTKKYKLDDSVLKKTVEVRGTELESEARRGRSETNLLMKAVKGDLTHIQTLQNYV